MLNPWCHDHRWTIEIIQYFCHKIDENHRTHAHMPLKVMIILYCTFVQLLEHCTMALQWHMHVFVCYVPHGPFTNIEADYV